MASASNHAAVGGGSMRAAPQPACTHLCHCYYNYYMQNNSLSLKKASSISNSSNRLDRAAPSTN
jgi:hypothetical protein